MGFMVFLANLKPTIMDSAIESDDEELQGPQEDYMPRLGPVGPCATLRPSDEAIDDDILLTYIIELDGKAR